MVFWGFLSSAGVEPSQNVLSWIVELLANAGTPLIWAGCFMLICGNWLIGHIESKLLGRQLMQKFSSGWIIAGNYVSMAVGFGILWAAGPIHARVALDPFDWGFQP